MTVLVLDHPELMSRTGFAAGMDMPASELPDTGTDSLPKRPHRLRFHYGFNQHRLNPEDQALLRQHALWLKHNPGACVHIHGHADVFGVGEYNEFLSRLRASSAAKLMLNEGARENQIVISGWGSERPLARPEDHAANRRLELQYLNMDMAQAL
ncbi:OmpA family protein [Marinobacter confluentis]|uniref:OmpA family protein n=1 Tax=Marinobacter confluentis TaxID=1697557 RepID=A0A4Z1C6C9_9GAMM|nr:OmpA family protein [Marinobacter confluentis]TGN38835.1 OmpA family protein [Marinobacter confluentis]